MPFFYKKNRNAGSQQISSFYQNNKTIKEDSQVIDFFQSYCVVALLYSLIFPLAKRFTTLALSLLQPPCPHFNVPFFEDTTRRVAKSGKMPLRKHKRV
jgi:hypothetical protein